MLIILYVIGIMGVLAYLSLSAKGAVWYDDDTGPTVKGCTAFLKAIFWPLFLAFSIFKKILEKNAPSLFKDEDEL
jgi:hypothetical protein